MKDGEPIPVGPLLNPPHPYLTPHTPLKEGETLHYPSPFTPAMISPVEIACIRLRELVQSEEWARGNMT